MTRRTPDWAMINAASYRSPQEPWPPRHGQMFFLFWIGAAFASWIGSQLITASVGFSGKPITRLDTQWIASLPSVVAALFHGWLLFSRGFRLGAWTALPAIHAAVPYFLKSAQPSALATAFGFASIATTIISTLLLVGVRRRPWLWLFVELGALVAKQLFAGLFFWRFGIADLQDLATRINQLLGLKGPILLSGVFLWTSALSAIWLASTILAGASLAWLMPPLQKEVSSDSPGQHDVKRAPLP